MSDREKLPTVDLGAEGVIEQTCQFCGRRFYIMVNERQLAHDEPPCPEYLGFEIIDFMRFNRERAETKAARA